MLPSYLKVYSGTTSVILFLKKNPWKTEKMNCSDILHFCLLVQGILTYYALGRFRRGVNEVTLSTYTEPPPDLHTPYPPTYAPTSYNPTTYTPTTYSVYPSSGPDMRQQPPINQNPQAQGDIGYQPPNYWDKRSSHGWGGVPCPCSSTAQTQSYIILILFYIWFNTFSTCCQICEAEQCSCNL